MMHRALYSSIAVGLMVAGSLPAADQVTFRRDGRQRAITGEVLVEAADGGLLVMDPTRTLWAITPDELMDRRQDDSPFRPLGAEQLGPRLLEEMPTGFRVFETTHYLIVYNTSPAYAEWCGRLYERLYVAFRNYWRKRDFELTDPQWPLVAVVFDSRASYADFARAELGEAVSSIIGYYSLRTNRVIMHDLTGVSGRLNLTSAAQVNRFLLTQSRAERQVATIIHEATHQLAFNCGLHTRYADVPLWVSEGVAIYFETPDLRSRRGWRNIGGVNQYRLSDFRRYVRRRPGNALVSLIGDDERFRNARTAPDAYAEAWAWNYFLIRKQTDAYLGYMRHLSGKRRLVYDTPQERLAEFRKFFGDDLEQLDREFLRYMGAVR